SACLVGLCLSAAPANAACAPDPASSGQTVTCSGNDSDGFQAGGGVNTLTVNVLPGATVSDGGGTAAIGVNDFNTITNSGTIAADIAPGILVQGDRSTITNSGHIVGGNGSAGIALLGDSNTIINSGRITVGNGVASGIEASGFARNDIVNTGTINVGTGATGISISGDGTVFNSGSINAATGSAAIEFCGCGLEMLTLGPGSMIQGIVIASGAGTFQLGGGGKDTFDLNSIGIQYLGFSIFNKVDSSNWTVTGTGAQDWKVLAVT